MSILPEGRTAQLQAIAEQPMFPPDRAAFLARVTEKKRQVDDIIKTCREHIHAHAYFMGMAMNALRDGDIRKARELMEKAGPSYRAAIDSLPR